VSRFDTPKVGADRLVTLTDGVFAIAMTILVLELGVPTAERAATSSKTPWHALPRRP
jgi:uncharacterized membrane protein